MKKLEERRKELENIRELLVVIDMVNGFVKEGNLAAPSIMRIVPRIETLLKYYLKDEEKGIAIIRDSHPENAIEFQTYGPHCIEGTKESELIDELKFAEPHTLTYLKNSTNLVFAKNFITDLKMMKNLQRIGFTGCLAEVCVENGVITTKNLLDELNRDVEVGVYSDAIDTYDAKGHERDIVIQEALHRMERNGAKIYKKGSM